MKRLTGLMLAGLFLALGSLNPAFAKDKKEKVPKGLKTKTAINYGFVEEKSGEYKKVLDNKQVYRYDKKGNQIEQVGYGADGKLEGKHLYKYDDKGNRIEWAMYNADGKLRAKFLYKYDDKGNQIEEAVYGADGRLEGKRLYKYDDKGKEIEWAGYDADGKL